MSDPKEKAMASLRDYCNTYFGGMMEHHQLMARHYPECLEHWMRARQSLFKEPPEGALSLREKELVILGLEITARHKDVEFHTRKAMEAGATAQQIAEVAGICMLLSGMVTFVEAGQRALRAAEEYEKKMKERPK